MHQSIHARQLDAAGSDHLRDPRSAGDPAIERLATVVHLIAVAVALVVVLTLLGAR